MPQNTVMYMRSALTKRRRCRRHCRLNATTHDRRRNGTKQNPPATTTLQGKENDRNVKTHTHDICTQTNDRNERGKCVATQISSIL